MSLEFEEVIDEKDVVERIVMLSKELEIGVVIEVIELIIKKEVSMLQRFMKIKSVFFEEIVEIFGLFDVVDSSSKIFFKISLKVMVFELFIESSVFVVEESVKIKLVKKMSVSEKEIIFELMIVVKIEKREIRVCKIYIFFIIYNYILICFNNVVNINI